jgi:hypothetical protein
VMLGIVHGFQHHFQMAAPIANPGFWTTSHLLSLSIRAADCPCWDRFG